MQIILIKRSLIDEEKRNMYRQSLQFEEQEVLVILRK